MKISVASLRVYRKLGRNDDVGWWWGSLVDRPRELRRRYVLYICNIIYILILYVYNIILADTLQRRRRDKTAAVVTCLRRATRERITACSGEHARRWGVYIKTVKKWTQDITCATSFYRASKHINQRVSKSRKKVNRNGTRPCAPRTYNPPPRRGGVSQI